VSKPGPEVLLERKNHPTLVQLIRRTAFFFCGDFLQLVKGKKGGRKTSKGVFPEKK
jgi:hypothetical protein